MMKLKKEIEIVAVKETQSELEGAACNFTDLLSDAVTRMVRYVYTVYVCDCTRIYNYLQSRFLINTHT